MTGAEQAAAHGAPSVQVPVDLGGEVVVYHLGISGASRLRLTGPVIARIFLGQITPPGPPE
jgi:ABC-type phosphate transport system substrate-binding protein